jgi:hypothetical protein
MATYLENLTTARDNLATKLASVTASPKPSYTIDGQTVSWTEYYKMLMDGINSLNEQLAAGEPFEIHTQGHSP